MRTILFVALATLCFHNPTKAQCPAGASIACADNSNSACPELYEAIITAIDTLNATEAEIDVDLNWTRCSASNASIEYVLMVGDPDDFDESEYSSATCFGPITVSDDCGTILFTATVLLDDIPNLYIASRGRTNGMCGGTTCETVIALVEAPLLPVELSKFKASYVRDDVILEWTTEFEIQNEGFVVQRSENSVTWTDLNFVEGHVDSDVPMEYQYVDRSPDGNRLYYRLLQRDLDGTESVSQVRSIYLDHSEVSGFSIYPNPISEEQLTIDLKSDLNTLVVIRNYKGETLLKVEAKNSSITVDTYDWQAGFYSVSLIQGNEIITESLIRL